MQLRVSQNMSYLMFGICYVTKIAYFYKLELFLFWCIVLGEAKVLLSALDKKLLAETKIFEAVQKHEFFKVIVPVNMTFLPVDVVVQSKLLCPEWLVPSKEAATRRGAF